MELMRDIDEYERDGFSVFDFTHIPCDENGRYGRIQENTEL